MLPIFEHWLPNFKIVHSREPGTEEMKTLLQASDLYL